MRRLYFIRHAKPDLPQRMCIGSTDIPLGMEGRIQCAVLARRMAEIPVSAVFSSDLRRARQTAAAFARAVTVIPGLREMDAGDWDGLTFAEIRRRWPEIYEKRGIAPETPIPGAEPAQAGQARFLAAVREALAQSSGDIAIVAHGTVIQSLICHAKGIPPALGRQFRLGYTSITTVDFDGDFHVVSMGENRVPPMDEALCNAILTAAEVPAPVIAHGKQVADTAAGLAEQLRLAGVALNRDLLYYAARLHDIARVHPNHPALGAAWLREAGYPEIAACMETHHDPVDLQISEGNLLFLADKMPIRERFAKSLEKCTTPDARAAHQRRLEAALALEDAICRICGTPLENPK